MAVIRGLLILVLILVLEIAVVGLLWVLRIALNWWLDIDYVDQINELLKKLKNPL